MFCEWLLAFISSHKSIESQYGSLDVSNRLKEDLKDDRQCKIPKYMAK